MTIWWAVGLVAGYLVGSVSGARVVAARVIPGVPLSPTRVIIDDRGHSAITTGVSSSMLRARAGPRAGLTAAVMDIAKGFVPVLAARLLSDDPAVVGLVALGAIVGHVYPVRHPRRGGYGMSTIMGVTLAVDPLGLLVVIVVGVAVCVVVGSPYVGSDLWIVFLPAWFWIVDDPWLVATMTCGVVLYLLRGLSELRPAFQSWRTDPRPWFRRWSDLWEYPLYEPVE